MYINAAPRLPEDLHHLQYLLGTCCKVYGLTHHCFSSIQSCWHYLIDPLYPLFSFVRLVCNPQCKASREKPPTCIVIEAFYVSGTESQKYIYLMHTKAGILYQSFSVYVFPTAQHNTSTWRYPNTLDCWRNLSKSLMSNHRSLSMWAKLIIA